MKMKKDKLTKKDISFFILPFLILTLGVGTLTYYTVKQRVKDVYNLMEKSSLNIADSYTAALLNYQEAYNIAVNLLEEKILVASRAVLLIDDNDSTSKSLKKLAKELQVDQINLYNRHGEIIVSNIEDYVGWKTYEGHPAYFFMHSNLSSIMEKSRPDSVSGEPYKFGYVRRDEETFVQIGVLDENLDRFTKQFELQNLIQDIVEKQDVDQAIFVDKDYKVLASSLIDSNDKIVEDVTIRTHINERKLDISQSSFQGEDVIHVCAPVYNKGTYLGTLLLIWPAGIVEQEIRSIAMGGFLEFLILMTVGGAILYYAYRKDKSNVKIAYYDELTGLPNSTYLEEYLEELVVSSTRNRKAVLLLNCTNFKTLNMTYGYKYGDRILQQISEKMNAVLRNDRILFRFNADRFVVVIDEFRSRNELLSMANKLVRAFKSPIDGGSKHEYLDVQVAVLELTGEHISADKVLKDASLALSHLRHYQNEQIIIYNDEMQNAISRKEAIEDTLRNVISGLDQKSFELYFQPLWDVKREETMGFEALARLQVEGYGNISPLEFIDLAEKNLLIYDLGLVIISRACEFLHRLSENGFEDMIIAINISLIQLLREEFTKDVHRILLKKGVAGSSLEFEITESILAENFEMINEKLAEVKRLGISIALDDFGTGFSSFARLRALHIDTVKVDRYFVKRITESSEEEIITADVISMAHKIKLNVIAEGVELEEQKEYLVKHHCDILQGYYISKPLPEEEALSFAKWNTKENAI